MAFQIKNYQFAEGNHKGNSVIWIKFPYNDILKKELRFFSHLLNGVLPKSLGMFQIIT
jgi:hypothetical protein